MNGVSEEAFDRIEEIKSQARQVFDELWEAAELSEGEILIVGCSSSEVASHRIGSWSSEEIGEALFETFYGACREKGIYLAAQCCEHLNRAVILPGEAAKRCGFSESYFMKLFKEFTGMSFNAYLVDYRLELAARQLSETGLKVIDIAENCGFRNHSYFTRAFRQKYGRTPVEYRKAAHTSHTQSAPTASSLQFTALP